MAVVNPKTTALSTADTNGDLMAIAGRQAYVMTAALDAANGDSIGSTYRLLRLPSNAVIHRMELAWDALGGSCAADLGVYDIAGNGGAVVDADQFASAVAMASAGGWTNELEEAVATDIDKIGQPIWKRLGLSKDSGKAYDIVATLTGAAAAAGSIVIRITYTTA